MDIELVKKAQKAFEWYDKAVDNSIDYLNLEREEQQDAWNALDKLFEAIARQSETSEEVQEAIEALKVCAWGNPDMSKQINLGIAALQAYQKQKPDCESAEKCGDKCCGYGKSEYDDEPIDVCKDCEKQISYGEE